MTDARPSRETRPVSAEGFGAAATPWRAVQRAAWAALAKAETLPG